MDDFNLSFSSESWLGGDSHIDFVAFSVMSSLCGNELHLIVIEINYEPLLFGLLFAFDFIDESAAGNTNDGFASIFSVLSSDCSIGSIVSMNVFSPQVGQIVETFMWFEHNVTPGSTVASIRFSFSNGFVNKVRNGPISSFSGVEEQFDLIRKVLKLKFRSSFLLGRYRFG